MRKISNLDASQKDLWKRNLIRPKKDISEILRKPTRYGQAEKTHTDSVLQTENKIVNLQERKKI